MDMPVNVPIDNPNADTEWKVPPNDILRKHGIIPEKPKDPEPLIQEALLKAQQRAHESRLADKDLDELHDLEDDEDDAFLEQYRQQRLAELSTLQKSSVHGQVYPLQKADYERDVTGASSKCFVLVLLTSSLGNNVESRILGELWRELAFKFGDIKFCEIRADLCIEGYPERNTPTILIYRNGDIKRQVITLRDFQGPRTNLDDLQRLLVELGAVPENDLRLKKRSEDDDAHQRRSIKRSAADKDDGGDDDDWD